MKKTSIEKITEWSNGTLMLGNEESIIERVSIDSRDIDKNAAFFAIKGANVDGHNYIASALFAGATTIIGSDESIITEEIKKYRKSAQNEKQIVQKDFINVILVEDSLTALQDIAMGYLKEWGIKVIAVTGSVGKTGVKDMIASICACKYYTSKTQGNFNSESGVPLTILNLDEKTELAVLEIGMDQRGEIKRLAQIANPDMAVVTNIGVSHIENLGSREAICAEKLDIASYFNEKSLLILNADDDMLSKHTEKTIYEKIFIGTEATLVPDTQLKISNIKAIGGITEFDACAGEERVHVRLPRPGKHNALNAGLALGVAKGLCISLPDAARALERAKYTGRRLEIKKAACGATIIDDSYNASPASMRAALAVLSEFPLGMGACGRRIAALADMLEMGKDSYEFHRELGDYLVDLNVDLLLTYGEAASYIAKGARNKLATLKRKKNMQIFEFMDKNELIEFVKEKLRPEDVILSKGSNSMKMDELCSALQN